MKLMGCSKSLNMKYLHLRWASCQSWILLWWIFLWMWVCVDFFYCYSLIWKWYSMAFFRIPMFFMGRSLYILGHWHESTAEELLPLMIRNGGAEHLGRPVSSLISAELRAAPLYIVVDFLALEDGGASRRARMWHSKDSDLANAARSPVRWAA
jgi:hypothetical protein